MKTNLIVKTWKRCKSIGRSPKKSLSAETTAGGETPRRSVIAPEGCFSVYVGQQRQRFVIRAEYANHPLFRALLEEAESEFGFSSDGPLVLPCDVALFQRVLVTMDDLGSRGGDDEDEDDDEVIRRLGCGGGGCSPYKRLVPSGVFAISQF